MALKDRIVALKDRIVALKDHDGPGARLAALVLAVVVVVGVPTLLVRWVVPGDATQKRVIRSACDDARALRHARLLSEARGAFRATIKVDGEVDAGGPFCSWPNPRIYMKVARAARARHRGQVYLAASSVKRPNALEPDRERALTKARRAFARSAAIDPFHVETRRELSAMLTAMPAPESRAEACRLAGTLRDDRLLPEAAIVYGQALRTGKATGCLRNGLRRVRRDVALGQRKLFNAEAAAAAGIHDNARERYLAALVANPALSEARTALADHPGPDPEEATTWGRISAVVDDGVDTLGDWVDWLTEHAAAIGLAAVALLVVVLLGMGLMMLLTRLRFVRGGLAPIRPLRRFTRPRVLLAAFTPEDKASSAGAVFAHHLSMAPLLKDPQRDWGNDTGEIDQDTWEAPAVPNDPLQDAATLFATIPQANFVAATMEWLRNTAPRREVRVLGQMLDADERGHGLRVLVARRGGRSSRSFTAWTKDLPGPQLADTPEARARHAVAVRAAAWAHQELKR